MSDNTDPFLDSTQSQDGGFVEITIAGGPYQSRKVVSRRPTLAQVEEELALAIKAVAGAGASLDRAVKEAETNQPAAPGQHGRPATANTPNTSDLPFASSTAEEAPNPSVCAHGDRTLYQAQGKKGWVCSLPKDNPARCATIFV